jgi:hypothetical protein
MWLLWVQTTVVMVCAAHAPVCPPPLRGCPAVVSRPFATEAECFAAQQRARVTYGTTHVQESLVPGQTLHHESTFWCEPTEARAEGEGTEEGRDGRGKAQGVSGDATVTSPRTA